MVLFLLGEAGELLAEGVFGGEEGFFAVEDGRVVAGEIVSAVELHRAEVELDRAHQRGVGVGFKIGIRQVGNLAAGAVELDQVGVFDFSQIGFGAPFVDAEQRLQRIDGCVVEVEGAREEVAYLGSLAGFVDCAVVCSAKDWRKFSWTIT